MTILQITNERAHSARRLCDHCGGAFGMVTHRRWGKKFCKRRCREAHIRDVKRDRRTIRLSRGLLAACRSSGRLMVTGFTWHRLRELRTLTCGGLILTFFASASDLEAGYCGRAFDFQAARIRWAGVRQSGPGSENPDQICRAYGSQFYEAVQARQEVLQCEVGGARQRDIEILDGEIEAFNNLIATRCGT
jgi:hypothetical protein